MNVARSPYVALAWAFIRSRASYRASFIARSIALAFADLTSILLIGIVIVRFGSLAGWGWPALALLYALSQISYAVARCVSVPLDHFDELIVSGDLDGVLTRPTRPLFHILAGGVELMNVGRIAVGITVLVVAGRAAGVRASAGNVALVVASVAGGACILFAMTWMVASLSFWTTRTGKLQDIVQSSSRAFAEYPLVIYPASIRFVLTWLVPVALVTYFPARRLLGLPGGDSPLAFAALPAGALLLGAAALLWRRGLRRYQSTGS